MNVLWLLTVSINLATSYGVQDVSIQAIEDHNAFVQYMSSIVHDDAAFIPSISMIAIIITMSVAVICGGLSSIKFNMKSIVLFSLMYLSQQNPVSAFSACDDIDISYLIDTDSIINNGDVVLDFISSVLMNGCSEESAFSVVLYGDNIPQNENIFIVKLKESHSAKQRDKKIGRIINALNPIFDKIKAVTDDSYTGNTKKVELLDAFNTVYKQNKPNRQHKNKKKLNTNARTEYNMGLHDDDNVYFIFDYYNNLISSSDDTESNHNNNDDICYLFNHQTVNETEYIHYLLGQKFDDINIFCDDLAFNDFDDRSFFWFSDENLNDVTVSETLYDITCPAVIELPEFECGSMLNLGNHDQWIDETTFIKCVLNELPRRNINTPPKLDDDSYILVRDYLDDGNTFKINDYLMVYPQIQHEIEDIGCWSPLYKIRDLQIENNENYTHSEEYTVLRLSVSIPPTPFEYILDADVCGDNVGSPWESTDDVDDDDDIDEEANDHEEIRRRLFWNSFTNWVEEAVEDGVEFVSDVADAIEDTYNDIVQSIAIETDATHNVHFFDSSWFPWIFSDEYIYEKSGTKEVTKGTKPTFTFTGTGTMTVKAGYDIDLSITLDFSFRWVVLTGEIYVYFRINVDWGITAEFGIELIGEVQVEIEKLLYFYKIKTFFIGPVPVVIKPFIVVNARVVSLPLRVYAGITCHYGEMLHVGYEYDNGNGNDVNSREPHSNNGCQKVFELGSEEENEEDCPVMELGFDVELEVKVGCNLYALVTVYGRAALELPFRITMPQFDNAICGGADTSCSNTLKVSFTIAMDLSLYIGVEVDFSTLGEIIESLVAGSDIDLGADDIDLPALETQIGSWEILPVTSLGCIDLIDPFDTYYKGLCCISGIGSSPVQGVAGYISFGQTKSGRISQSQSNDIRKYAVKIESQTAIIVFETCGSETDTWLYWYDSDMNMIKSCDDCNAYGDWCSTKGDLGITDVAPGTYYIGVGTYASNYGNYQIEMIPEDDTIFLVDGSNEYEGRLMIVHQYITGTVCDDSFGALDGTVVCSQLGYEFDRVADYGEFGSGEGQIWLDDVGCSGTESSVDACSHGGWGVHDCTHSKDVGVVCIGTMSIGETKAGTIKANEIKKYKVVIETAHQSIIFESCESSYDTYLYWYDSNMNLLDSCDDCNDYGYYCATRGDLKIRNVQPGTYYFGIGGYSNNFGDYVIGAFFDDTPDSTVRLIGGSHKYEGRLEIFHDLEWGTVCRDYWSLAASELVCNELGTEMMGFNALIYNTDNRFGNAEGQIWLDDVQCSGSESSLSECPHAGFGSHNCDHSKDVHIRCIGVINEHETEFGELHEAETNMVMYYRVALAEDHPWVIFEACGSDFDTKLFWMTAKNRYSQNCWGCNNFGADCGTRGDLGISNVQAGTYYLAIGGITVGGYYKVKMYFDDTNAAPAKVEGINEIKDLSLLDLPDFRSPAGITVNGMEYNDKIMIATIISLSILLLFLIGFLIWCFCKKSNASQILIKVPTFESEIDDTETENDSL